MYLFIVHDQTIHTWTCLAAQHLRETCGWIYCAQRHFTVGLDQTIHSWTCLAAQQTCGWIYCTQCHFAVGLDQSIHSWTDSFGGASVTSQLGLTKPFTAGLVWRRNNFGKHVAGFIVHSVTSQLGLTKACTAGRTCLAAPASLHSWA